MTDRMTERFDSPDGPGTESDLPVYGTTDVDATMGASQTVTRSAAVDEASLGQGGGSGKADVAKDHATAVAQDVKDSGKGVASTAASEAKDVAHEATSQVRSLFSQLSSEAGQQASGQTQRAAEGLRSLGKELTSMAESQQGESGMAANLARQGASRLDAAASWIEGRQPGEILDEVRSFASRRPGLFLGGAALLGLIGGRMTSGLKGGSSGGSGQSASQLPSQSTERYSVGTVPTVTGAQYATEPVYGTDATVGTGTGYGTGTGAGYGEGTAYVGGPVDEGLTDPTRVDAGIDPASHTHPGPSTGVSGESL